MKKFFTCVLIIFAISISYAGENDVGIDSNENTLEQICNADIVSNVEAVQIVNLKASQEIISNDAMINQFVNFKNTVLYGSFVAQEVASVRIFYKQVTIKNQKESRHYIPNIGYPSRA